MSIAEHVIETVQKEEKEKAKTEYKKEFKKEKLIGDTADNLAFELKDKNELFFKTNEFKIVKIESIQDEKENKYYGFKQITASQLITHIEKHLKPGYWFKKDDDWTFREKSLTKNDCQTILEADQFKKQLPIIERIFTVGKPLIYNGVLTLPKKGYDKRFKSWLSYDTPEISIDIPINEAKENITKLFDEFCFKDEQDKTNAIAGLITPYLRGLYSRTTIRTPVFYYEGNRPRVGKDYCAGMTGILYEGYPNEEPAISTTDNKKVAHGEELRKKLTTALRNGRTRLHFSNNKGHFDNAIFEGFVTQEKYTDRLLSKNEEITFNNEMEISLSGNAGLTYTPDFQGRIRKIRLFLDIEDPNKREFNKPNLWGYVIENRELILSSLYSLIKNWYDNGQPKGNTLFTSFPEWAEICGGIMQYNNFGDPCVPDEEILSIGGDTETQDIKLFFELMYELNPEEWIKKSELKDYLLDMQLENELFRWLNFEKKSDQTKFGLIIEKYVGRLFSEIKLIKDGTANRTSRHRFKFTKSEEIKDCEKQEKLVIDEKTKIKGGNLGNVGNVSLEPRDEIINYNSGIKKVAKVANVTTSIGNFKRVDNSHHKCNNCGETHSKGWNLENQKDSSIWCDVCASVDDEVLE